MFLTGFGMMVQTASSKTVLRTIAEEDKRGRVMSFYAMAFMGMAPLSGLENDVLAPIWNRLSKFFFRHGKHFYNF